jgi:acyl-coenzyme A thioesterase PaaI-like protein
MPLAGNQNHLGSLYAGALFTLAEVPGGALFFSSFDSQRFIPLVKAFNLRFLRPALSDITVEARLDAEQIAALQDSAERLGKAEFSLALQLQDNQGQVVALSEGLYQIRKR